MATCYMSRLQFAAISFSSSRTIARDVYLHRGGVRVCGDAVLCYFWCGFAVILILTRGIAVSKD